MLPISKKKKKFSFIYLFSNLYTHCWAWTHNPQIKSQELFWLSQPGPPDNLFQSTVYKKKSAKVIDSFKLLLKKKLVGRKGNIDFEHRSGR